MSSILADNSTLVYERGGALRGLSQWVQLCTLSTNKLWRSNSIFNLCFVSFGFQKPVQILPARRNLKTFVGVMLFSSLHFSPGKRKFFVCSVLLPVFFWWPLSYDKDMKGAPPPCFLLHCHFLSPQKRRDDLDGYTYRYCTWITCFLIRCIKIGLSTRCCPSSINDNQSC